MNINFDETFVAQIITELKPLIVTTVQDAIKQSKSDSRPYLNRKEIAKYLGVAQSTVGVWVKQGMPFAVIDGRKLYGKQTVNQWLKDHEMTIETPSQHQRHQKSPQLLA
ncbi:helix-turn-helix domain-containing protein [Lactobacillus crispatus]|uniref:helix-turn-helix domain-containing protein n=1 Tax=Lactobacillus crispatus TaxID=47770 RepID=UPI00168BC703|nr:helix-turn-helix domain-containing protein [Lactobacillus crispatus]